jgi:hypothetical protein
MATDPLDDILRRAADLTAEQRVELIRKLQQTATQNNGTDSGRTLFDAFNDHGMIGSITDAPADWSTNPKYMEGFGKDAE